MIQKIDLHRQVQDYGIIYKTALKALWEDFLCSEWRGETYNDFVLLKWLETRREAYFHQTKASLINIIYDKREVSIENWEFRRKLDRKNLRENRRAHYKCMIRWNRELIHGYNNLIIKYLGGFTSQCRV